MSKPNPFIEHPAATGRVTADREHWLFSFPNGHGASVVRDPYTYGGKAGLWELAVLDSDGELDYSTPITDDVLGWQTVEQIRDALRAIAELPALVTA